MDLSDAFMVVRNGSKHDHDPSAPCFEQAYQFVGNRAIQLNKRPLNNNAEWYDFRKTRIDFANSDKLVVLNLYNISAI